MVNVTPVIPVSSARIVAIDTTVTENGDARERSLEAVRHVPGVGLASNP